MNEPKRIQWILDDLLNNVDNFGDWESEFIVSVSDQFQEKGTLTDKQYDKLEEIYARM